MKPFTIARSGSFRIRAQILGARLFLARSKQPALHMIAFNIRQLPEYISVQRAVLVLLDFVIVPSLVFHLVLFVSPLLVSGGFC